MKRRLLWQIFPSYLVISILALAAFAINISFLIDDFFTQQTRQNLEIRARLVMSDMENAILKTDTDSIDRECKKLGHETKTRITVVDPSGRVLGESEKNPQSMENHLSRPEIQQAFTSHVTAFDIRPSTTLKQQMMYVAVPCSQDNKIVAVVRTSVPLIEIEQTIHTITHHVIKYCLVIIIVLATISLLFSWKLSRPLMLMQKGAQRFAQGQFSQKLDIHGKGELADLARAMNAMADEINHRIQAATRQQNQQQAVFTAMLEGVIAFNAEGQCITLNTAAARLLQIDIATAEGRTVGELIRNSDLQQFIQNAIQSTQSAESFILMPEAGQQELFLQVRASALLDSSGSHIGSLIVLNDMTRIHRLEQVRRDFVANVSHELKTPVTSIQGFVETLQDGAINNPEDAKRFIGIIARQTDRLNSIIEDLLLLCELEQKGETSHIPRETCSIHEVLSEAVELCRHKAKDRQITLYVNCPKNLTLRANASLLEQAIVNLTDNAIKYSSPDTQVDISAAAEGNQVVIRVRDSGCGIALEHQARIFERFFRVDKARSRQLGGTGLGLAIVKHIAHYHKGTISVQSVPGKGSTFAMSLPINNASEA